MSETTQFITYYSTSKARINSSTSSSNVHSLFPNENADHIPETQQQAVGDYLELFKSQGNVVSSFVEIVDNRKTNDWPQLNQALHACRTNDAKLIIAELGTLTSNQAFTQALLDSGVEFYCCDQPFVNQTILEALCKHAQIQRKLHGKLIREGLKHTSAKSGNPNAAEVISKVNKPKIDAAIVFALLLQPIIANYKRKGYSQRQMVKTLNEEGFTAPEGGKWVLSQLQKVLDRVKLNEITNSTSEYLKEINYMTLSDAEIAEKLNSKEISSLKRSAWDEAQVKKLIGRLKQIEEIEQINQFFLDLLPILHNFRDNNLSVSEMLSRFAAAGVPINKAQAAA